MSVPDLITCPQDGTGQTAAVILLSTVAEGERGGERDVLGLISRVVAYIYYCINGSVGTLRYM